MAAPSTRRFIPLLPTGGPVGTFTVINGTASSLSAGATTVTAFSYKDSISLTAAQLATLAATAGVFVTVTTASSQQQFRDILKRVIRYTST